MSEQFFTNVEISDTTEWINTLSNKSDDGVKLLSVDAVNDALPLGEYIGETIQLCDVITKQGTRYSKYTGTESACQDTYLFDTDGTCYYTQSDGVATSINMLVSVFPDLTYKDQDYIEVEVCRKQLRNGNTLMTVRPVV